MTRTMLIMITVVAIGAGAMLSYAGGPTNRFTDGQLLMANELNANFDEVWAELDEAKRRLRILEGTEGVAGGNGPAPAAGTSTSRGFSAELLLRGRVAPEAKGPATLFEAQYESARSDLVFHLSGSAFGEIAGERLVIVLRVDGSTVGEAVVFAPGPRIHTSFSTTFVYKATAGKHLVQIDVRGKTRTDDTDRYNLAVMEIPE